MIVLDSRLGRQKAKFGGALPPIADKVFNTAMPVSADCTRCRRSSTRGVEVLEGVAGFWVLLMSLDPTQGSLDW